MSTDEELAKAAEKYSLDGYLRRHPFTATSIPLSALETQCRAFEEWEPRDSMYRVSTFLVGEWWNEPEKLVDALSVLLLVWNDAFYRYGSFDEQALETCIQKNQPMMSAFREREISSFCDADEADISKMFLLLLQALKRRRDGAESPVAVGKALHLLAPNFFPLWDQYIAPAYACPYSGELPNVAYIAFTRRVRAMAVQLGAELASDRDAQKDWLSRKTLLKRMDEYNYMKYTVPAMEEKKGRKKAKPTH